MNTGHWYEPSAFHKVFKNVKTKKAINILGFLEQNNGIDDSIFEIYICLQNAKILMLFVIPMLYLRNAKIS